MLERLSQSSELPKDFIEDGRTFFSRLLSQCLESDPERATKIDLARYDDNIITHSQTLGMAGDSGKSWKPFQYAALLFTERYLNLYFDNQDVLVDMLNAWIQKHEKRRHHKMRGHSAPEIDRYTSNDLRTLAFQSATGSGKTLLLHANILQYGHYLEQHGQLRKLNKVILLTPDEGLSRQHLGALRTSNISAQLFSDDAGAEIYSRGGVVVDIIDLHKLDEKKGIKRVALEAFEDNNLVMVDEGHLGTGGKVWRKRRKQLARNGFTFEYSATFNQAVSGNSKEIKKLRAEYGKSILFDYSYKFFYADGYGKDYKISNLKDTKDSETNRLYLLACLLTFYQQCRIYEDKSRQWQAFNITRPLWVFLGKTVTGGKTFGKQATETDVIRIIHFLAWTQSEQGQVELGIKQLTSGKTGLVDDKGTDIFRKSFPYIVGDTPREIYDGLRDSIFRGTGQLRVSHLTGTDELQFSAGDMVPFGVVNVGDASGLYTKLEAIENRAFSLTKDAFSKPRFADVDNNHSPINIVVGARKFAAGWNSWRVSTMGLMHVGTGEGPQIIQMFGRGIRLKGYKMSLKRHTAIGDARPHDEELLRLLETLNIFGLRANYMDKFREYLKKEDINTDWVKITLETRRQFKNVNDLKILQKSKNVGEFCYSDERIALPEVRDAKDRDAEDCISLDRYRHLQLLQSDEEQAGITGSDKQTRVFDKQHLDLMSKRTIYRKVIERKRRSSWHNMTIARETVDALLENQDCMNCISHLRNLI